MCPGADPGFLKRGKGSILGLQATKGGGVHEAVQIGANVKNPTSSAKKGGADPLDPPPGSAHGAYGGYKVQIDQMYTNVCERPFRSSGVSYS